MSLARHSRGEAAKDQSRVHHQHLTNLPKYGTCVWGSEGTECVWGSDGTECVGFRWQCVWGSDGALNVSEGTECVCLGSDGTEYMRFRW